MEDLKKIIQKLNVMFQCEYNLSSFDAISGDDLLNVVIKVLKHIKVFEEDAKTAPSHQILHILEAIKYEPPKQTRPETFRNGLVTACKEIVHPILLFLLENKENVQKRFYLSKYVTPIDIPLEFLKHDTKMQKLQFSLNAAIEVFWKAYSGNSQEAKNNQEAEELENDVFQMKTDLENIQKRIDVQATKMEYSESVLSVTKDLIQERKKLQKLSAQLNSDVLNLNEQTQLIRRYRRRDKIEKLEDLLERSEYHADAKHIYQKMIDDLETEVHITEVVFAGCEPTASELQPLEEQELDLQQEITNLNNKRQQDSTIEAFKNQQKILVKKKGLLSKLVIKIQLANEQTLNKIEELCQVLGGNVLRGKRFREYLGDLRKLSITYKTDQHYLKSMKDEYAILEFTLRKLYDLDPSSKPKSDSSNTTLDEIKDLPLVEVKNKTIKLHKEFEEAMKECFLEESKYQNFKDVFSQNLIEFDQLKHTFNEKTEYISDKVECLEKELKLVENLLTMEEEDLQQEESESEKLQDNLLRYSQMFIENAGDVSNILNQKLAELLKNLDDLRKKYDLRQQTDYAEEFQKLLIKSTTTLILEGKMRRSN